MTQSLTLEAHQEDLRMKAPFRISGYTFEHWPVAVATLQRGGRKGRGEASGVYYLKEYAADIVARLQGMASALPADLTREALRRIMPPCGARNALDSALWDLESAETGKPAWALAGMAAPKPLVTTLTLSADPPAQVRAATQALTEAKAIKLKLTGESDIDIERVRAVRSVRPDVWLGVDANQGYRPDTLGPLIPVLVEARVGLLEQPFQRGREADMEGLKLPLPVAADESCQDLAELETLIGRFDIVNIKLDKCGGLTEALMIAARARELGLGVMVGNMMGTSLAAAPAFLLGQLCDVVDLDNALPLVKDRDPPISYAGGDVWVPAEAWGIGHVSLKGRDMEIIGEGPATLLGATQFDVRAPNADAIYRVQVYAPEAPPPAEGYPVVWLTDGAVMFAQAAPHMWFRAGLELRPAVLVGIGYPETDRQTNNTRRAYDFTPPTPPGIEPHAGWPTGGIDLFSAFLIDHLRPAIAARWPIDANDQTLYGHSLGGFFALSIFLKRPSSFKAYVASSPSLWWNKGQLESQLNAALDAPTSDMLSRRMLLSAGALEETAPQIYPGATPDSIAALAAALSDVAMVRRAEAMSARMQRAGIDSRFIAFAREGHGSVIGAAVARALEFALGYDPSRV